jgi:hypothetical protein
MTRYYRDYNGHILELDDASTLRDLYCKTCNRLLNLRVDTTPLIKYRGQLFETYSVKGQAILARRKRAKARHALAKVNWRLAHPDYFKDRYTAKKAEIDQKNKDWEAQNRDRRDAWKRDYMTGYNARPEVQKAKLQYVQLKRGLAKLGLGESPDKKARLRKQLKVRGLIRTADPLTLIPKTT